MNEVNKEVIGKYGAVKKFFGVIFEPAKSFEEIKDKPTFLFPFIIMSIVVGVTTYAMMPYMDIISAYSLELMGVTPDHPAFQQQNVQQPLFITIPLGILSVILGWVVMAGLCRLLSMIFVGEGNFKKDLSVFANTYVFSLIGSIISAVLLVATGSAAKMNVSLSLFTPFLEKTSFTFWLLNSINIFTLWGLIIAALGISIVENIKKVKAYLIVFTPWLLGKIIVVAFNVLLVIPQLQRMG
ncbi:MAG: YIP1 family protein [Clostridiaceae bacterium]|nr:YIP1 family protein [Clostridiaceae bacterium]